MRRHKDEFEYMIDDDYDRYLKKLGELKVLAGKVEMKALSEMLDIGFIIFKDIGKQPTQIGSTSPLCKKVLLCCSYDQHYDSVYPRSFLAVTAFCQAIIYELLYKKVFRMGNEATKAVEKMLHDKNYTRQRRAHLPTTLRLSDNIDLDGNDPEVEVREALEQGIPPFPFKVAKALDPDIFRNVEYDAWNEIRKDQIRAELNGTAEFQPGDKCLVAIDLEKDEWHIGHIQEMNPDKGPVTVFVEELGEKCTIPYENLETLQTFRETGKARIFRNRSPNEYNLSVSMNSANHHRLKAQLNLKTINRYQRSVAINSNRLAISSAKRTYVPRSGSVCSKDENLSFEASNEFCQNGECSMESNYELEESIENVGMESSGSFLKSGDCQELNGSAQTSHYDARNYQSVSYEAPPQISTSILPPVGSFYVPNAVTDPCYSFNQNACRSNDINGNDLPMSDVNTLRFFYNLGLDYYRMSLQTQTPIHYNGYHEIVPVISNTSVYQASVANNDAMISMTQPCGYNPMNQQYQSSMMYGQATPVFVVPPVQGNVPTGQFTQSYS